MSLYYIDSKGFCRDCFSNRLIDPFVAPPNQKEIFLLKVTSAKKKASDDRQYKFLLQGRPIN